MRIRIWIIFIDIRFFWFVIFFVTVIIVICFIIYVIVIVILRLGLIDIIIHVHHVTNRLFNLPLIVVLILIKVIL